MTPKGTAGWIASGALALLCASDAGAWSSHYLRAQAGNPFSVDASTGVDDTSVDDKPPSAPSDARSGDRH